MKLITSSLATTAAGIALVLQPVNGNSRAGLRNLQEDTSESMAYSSSIVGSGEKLAEMTSNIGGSKSGKGAKNDLSPATTYPNLPKHCRGVVPNMLGEFFFFGFRYEGKPAQDPLNLASWTEGMGTPDPFSGVTDGVPRPIQGLEWVPWTDGPYYMLAINSPAGLVRRFCTFDPWDNRTSTCTGVDYRDESVTELLYVTEVDEDCNATSFGIVTTKAFVPGPVCKAGEQPTGDDCTAISNMFVDKVQGRRTQYAYPETPADIGDFAN